MLNINIEQLNIKDSPQVTLLTNVNLQLEKGFVYSIIGKNGEGKSTFLKAITNLLDKNKFEICGKVLYDETDLLSLAENELVKYRKEKIKYVFQDSLRSFDQLKKLKYYFDLFGNQAEIDKLLKYFLLPASSEISSYYPYELSYGMAQRLGFIFALASKPEFILMDEPTSSLDQEIIDLFKNKIKDYVKQNNGMVLLATHDVDFGNEVSDYIAVLNEKTIQNFYPPEEFFKIYFFDKK